jgi:phosphoribosyl 1,2-cyclic phosphodiesterase
MKLEFLGTRGEIAARTRRHYRHSALAVSPRGARGDHCGADWRSRVAKLQPDAIVLTHGHPDHARGLQDGAPCPLYATAPTWAILRRYPLADRRLIEPGRPARIGGLVFAAFPVEHSLLAPAVGYRVGYGRCVFFYAPDLVSIRRRSAALAGVRLYVGDGASLERPLVRRRGRHLIGHASVRQQLDWCRQARVPRVIVTHCGSGIVGGDPRAVARWLRAAAAESGLEAAIAHDGLIVELSP